MQPVLSVKLHLNGQQTRPLSYSVQKNGQTPGPSMQAALNRHRMTFFLSSDRTKRTATKNYSGTGQINSFSVIVWC